MPWFFLGMYVTPTSLHIFLNSSPPEGLCTLWMTRSSAVCSHFFQISNHRWRFCAIKDQYGDDSLHRFNNLTTCA